MIKAEPINKDTFYWVKISKESQPPGEYFYCKLAYSLPDAARAVTNFIAANAAPDGAIEGKSVWIESIN